MMTITRMMMMMMTMEGDNGDDNGELGNMADDDESIFTFSRKL